MRGTAWYSQFAKTAAHFCDRPRVFTLAVGVIVVWIVAGPVFHFSDTWQLVINTGTTIVTFLMVFLIQKTQNKDSIAIQIKLNELVAANDKASNRIISVEDLTEEELIIINKYYERLAAMTKKERDIHSSHSIDEASRRHREKFPEKKSPGNKS